MNEIDFHKPKRLTLLGKALLLKYYPVSNTRTLRQKKFPSHHYLFMDERKKKQLYIISTKHANPVGFNPTTDVKAYSDYFMFHGKKPPSKKVMNFRNPQCLTIDGYGHTIEYETNKKHGGGDGKPAVYYHRFESPVSIFHESNRKNTSYIIGNKLRVTSAGIEN